MKQLVLVTLVLITMAGCRSESTTTTTTSSTEAADPITTLSSASTTTANPTTTTGKVYLARIEFDGLISHIIDPANKSRAVLITDAGHVTKLRINGPTTVAPDVKDAIARLEAELGGQARCDAYGCEVGPLTGLSLRIATASGKAMEPALSTDKLFDALVPHLEPLGITAVHSVIQKDALPSASYTAFFELNGGTLSAKPYCGTGRLQKDGVKGDPRLFARTTILSGSSPDPLELQYLKAGATDWKPLALHAAEIIDLTIENWPSGRNAMPHFHLHAAVSADSASKLPEVVDFATCQASTAVGCGSSTWP